MRVGDTIDFWRVEGFEPDHLLRLRAEMQLPGRAWLQLEVEPDGTGSTITQTALFDPDGVAGLAYWYLIWPIHRRIFASMLRGIARAERRCRALTTRRDAQERSAGSGQPLLEVTRDQRHCVLQLAHVRGTGEVRRRRPSPLSSAQKVAKVTRSVKRPSTNRRDIVAATPGQRSTIEWM